MLIKDSVFRSVLLDSETSDMDLIAYNTLITNIRILSSVMMEHVEEKKFTEIAEPIYKYPIKYQDFEIHIGNNFHCTRARLLKEATKLSDKERKFFKAYHDLTRTNQEVYISSQNKALTKEVIERFYVAGIEMEKFLNDNKDSVMAQLIYVKDGQGEAMWTEMKAYFQGVVKRSQQMNMMMIEEDQRVQESKEQAVESNTKEPEKQGHMVDTSKGKMVTLDEIRNGKKAN